MRAALIPVVSLAAFYATLLARKLPWLRSLNERGIKPIACSVCMAAWCSLLFGLLLSAGYLAQYDWTGWCELVALVAASAGGALILLEAHGWASQHLGLDIEMEPDDYKEPMP